MQYRCKKCGAEVEADGKMKLSAFKSRPLRLYARYNCPNCGFRSFRERAR